MIGGPLRNAQIDFGRHFAAGRAFDLFFVIQHQQQCRHVKYPRHEVLTEISRLFERQGRRQIARHFKQGAHAMFAIGRDRRLEAQPRSDLSDQQGDTQHHHEGHRIVDVGDRERKPRWHLEEIEAGHRQYGGESARARATAIRGQHRREQ